MGKKKFTPKQRLEILDHDILKQGYSMLKKWQAQDEKNK